MKYARPRLMTTVANPPPMKPSHVFFGLSWIRGVLPIVKPNMYAMMSLMITIMMGMMNQISPSNMFWMIR